MKRRRGKPGPLLVGPVAEDRGQRPVADDQVRPRDPCPRELLVDHQLLDRTGIAAVRRRPVRHEISGVGDGDPALLLVQPVERHQELANRFPRRPGLGAEIDRAGAAYAGLRHDRCLLLPRRRPTEDLPRRQRALEIEVRVVLPGEPDATEHLDQALGDVNRGLRGDRRRDRHRERPGVRVEVGIIQRRRGVPRRRASQFEVAQHVRAAMLHCLEAADRMTELLAHLGVVDRRLDAPSGRPRCLGGQKDGRGRRDLGLGESGQGTARVGDRLTTRRRDPAGRVDSRRRRQVERRGVDGVPVTVDRQDDRADRGSTEQLTAERHRRGERAVTGAGLNLRLQVGGAVLADQQRGQEGRDYRPRGKRPAELLNRDADLDGPGIPRQGQQFLTRKRVPALR